MATRLFGISNYFKLHRPFNGYFTSDTLDIPDTAQRGKGFSRLGSLSNMMSSPVGQ